MSGHCPSYKYIFHGKRLDTADEFKSFFSNLKLDNSDNWLTFKEGKTLSLGKTSCFRVSATNSDGVIYFKRYDYRKYKWEFFLRRSKAATELTSYQTLKNIGIPTLNVIALYEERTLGCLETACIVTEEKPRTLQLDDFYQNILLKMPSEQQHIVFKSIKSQLFNQLKKAHNVGFFHLDLKWRNILIQQNGDAYTPIWIDCPRGIQRRFFNYRFKVADLSGLARKAISFFSTQQLYRMLLQYLGKSASKEDARKLFTDISKHINRRPPKGWKN